MRVRVQQDRPLLDLLKAIRVSWDELRDLEHTPLRLVQQWSDVPAGRTLFDTLVVYQSYEFESALRAQGDAWAPRRFRLYEQPPFGLSLSVWGTGRTYVRLGYDRSKIDDATADRLFAQVITLFEQIARDPLVRVGDIPFLPASERATTLEDFNATAMDVAPSTLHGLMEAHVKSHPDAVALRFNGDSLTFREFDEQASRVAMGLQRAGVGRGVIVGLSVERSFSFPVGVFGILKAGGAWLPLDPSYPADRLAYMLQDSGAPVLLTQHALAGRSAGAPTTLCIEDLLAEHFADATPAVDEAGPDDPAYVIYTSGSTGRPKGARLLHRGAVNLAAALARAFESRPDDRILQFSALSFDASVLELVWSLCQGNRLVLAPHDVIVNPDSLAQLIDAEGITGALMPPVMLRVLDPAVVPSFTAVVSGGDACGADVVDRWAPGRRFYNAYGPTEITVAATVARCYEGAGRTPPIGGPLANCTAYVLDPRGTPVPIGVAGELWVGGAGVGAGYLNRPELSAERFVSDPFASTPGARLYRTGDSVFWRADGQLEYLGRLDDQVKLRGFRIELGEIEAQIAKLEGVRDVVVALREDIPGDKRLVAYVVAAQLGAPPSPATLRASLGTALPAYMIPAAFVTLDALPLAPSGKVDRRRLPPAGAEHLAADESAYVAPRNASERRLAELWAQVLRVPRVGIHDNFFEMGGDSILSMQIVARARPAGITLTPKLLFQHQTVELLGRAIEGAGGFAPTFTPQRVHGPEAGDAPLTPIQRWFFEQELADPHWWNQSFLFSAREALDVRALEEAVAALIGHHDALRLSYTRAGDGWRQRHSDAAGDTAIVCVDLTDVANDALPAEIESRATHLQASLHLENGPLVRVGYFDLGPTRGARVLVAIHHLVVDGVSWRMLVEDLESAYEQRLRDEPVVLPPRTTSFKQWGERLMAYAATEGLERERGYWDAVCADGTSTLPYDHRDGSVHESEVRASSTWLDSEETRTLLQRVPPAYNTRIDDVLLAALSMALAGWAGDRQILIDMEGHGREDVIDDVDLSRTVGWFTTIFPFRLDLAVAGRGPSTVLRTVKEQLRSIPNRGIGYGVLRYLAGGRSLSSDGQIAFNYLGQFDHVVAGSRRFEFAAEPSGAWRSPEATRRHPMDVLALVNGGRLEVRWNYSRAVMDDATVERLAAAYMRALRELIAHCVTPGIGGYTPSDFPLARVDQQSLDRLVGTDRDIEDIYPLVGVQKLFHGFTDAATDPGFEQFRYRLSGALNVPALRAAWNAVVSRHQILRTAFVSVGLEYPLQVVHRNTLLPFSEIDLRHEGADEQHRRIAELHTSDRQAGFAFDRAPLMRITLLRLADDRYELVWSHHHLLLDRWSLPLIMRDLSTAYAAHSTGRTLEFAPAVRYRNYVEWLGRQDEQAAEAYWRRAFEGYAPAAPLHELLDALPVHPSDAPADAKVSLTVEETARVHAFARELRVPPNAVVQAAWALWLARQTGRTDVVFGLALAGRPADVAGIDQMVGVTIANLPLRVNVLDGSTADAFVASVQDAQTELQLFAHTPLERVQAWSGVPWRFRLFESMLVFQHHGADESMHTWLGPAVEIEMVDVGTSTAYPLTITVTGERALAFQVSADPRLFSTKEVRLAAAGLRATLLALASDRAVALRTLLDRLPAPPVRDASRPSRPPLGAAHRVTPRDATEAVLARIWSELLGVTDLGVTDNFLERGGHSLLATQLVSRVRDTFQQQVSVRALFQAPTVAEFADALRAGERKAGQVDRIAQLVQRVEGMSPEQLRQAAAARKKSAHEKSTADGH